MVGALLVLKTNVVRPLDAMAVKLIGADPARTGEVGAKVTDCVASPARLITTTALAEALAYEAFPG